LLTSAAARAARPSRAAMARACDSFMVATRYFTMGAGAIKYHTREVVKFVTVKLWVLSGCAESPRSVGRTHTYLCCSICAGGRAALTGLITTGAMAMLPLPPVSSPRCMIYAGT